MVVYITNGYTLMTVEAGERPPSLPARLPSCRKAKDTVMILGHMVKWADEHKSEITELERLLGELRKAEGNIEARTYRPRTDAAQQATANKKSRGGGRKEDKNEHI